LIKEGILNLYKPSGEGSNDCIYKMRRASGIKKIGHTGTLDPMASGVLPLCIGSAARITEYLDLDFKTYICTMELGYETDTLDATGEIVKDMRQSMELSKVRANDVERVVSAFHGYVEQTPPKYSAVWVDGRRLYNYARAGEEVEIPKRRVYISDFQIMEIALPVVRFKVTCSKGTYIRSICRDIGDSLGVCGTMTALLRTQSGIFTADSAITVEKLKEIEEMRRAGDPACDDVLNSLLIEPEKALTHFGKFVVDTKLGRDFCNGWHISMNDGEVVEEPEFKGYNGPLEIRPEYKRAYKMFMNDQFLGVAFFSHQYHKLVADKVFYKEFSKEKISE